MNAFHRSRRNPAEPAPSAAERRARNLDYCEDLVERGMALARAASDRAMSDIAAPPPVARIPGSAAAEIAQWKEEARRRGPDYGKLFTHLTRAIRQTMLLEMYLAEGHTPEPECRAPPTERRPATEPAPNPRPHHDSLRREPMERMDCALPVGPDGEIQVEEILRTICIALGHTGDEPQTSPAAELCGGRPAKAPMSGSQQAERGSRPRLPP